MNLGDWIKRSHRLADQLDALEVRYSINVAIALPPTSIFDSETRAIDVTKPVRTTFQLGPNDVEPVHVHHFKIEAPNGPTSDGVCECGERRTYKNSDREDDGEAHRYESGARGRGAPCSICGRGTRDRRHRKG